MHATIYFSNVGCEAIRARIALKLGILLNVMIRNAFSFQIQLVHPARGRDYLWRVGRWTCRPIFPIYNCANYGTQTPNVSEMLLLLVHNRGFRHWNIPSFGHFRMIVRRYTDIGAKRKKMWHSKVETLCTCKYMYVIYKSVYKGLFRNCNLIKQYVILVY